MWLYSDLQHGTSLRLACLCEEENRPVTPTPYWTFVVDQKTTLVFFFYWEKPEQTEDLNR